MYARYFTKMPSSRLPLRSVLTLHLVALLCTTLNALFCLQSLTIFQRSLTTMQIQIQGLLQFAVPLFPTAEVIHTQTCCPITKLNHSWSSIRGIFMCQVFFRDTVCWPPHRETYWVSSICSTPQRPVCTSWPPCWTAEDSTRFVHCILIGITAAHLGQQESKWPRRIAASKWKWNCEGNSERHNRKNFKFNEIRFSKLYFFMPLHGDNHDSICYIFEMSMQPHVRLILMNAYLSNIMRNFNKIRRHFCFFVICLSLEFQTRR